MEHSRNLFRIEVQLSEGAELSQRSDVPLDIGRMNHAGFRRQNKNLELFEKRSPIEQQVCPWSEVMFPPVVGQLCPWSWILRVCAYFVNTMNILANRSATLGSMPGAKDSS